MIHKTRQINEGHRPVAAPGTSPRPPAPPPAGGPLPVEAQIFLRVMGEDLSGARDLLRDMPPLERAILLFWTEQIAGLVYEAEGLD
jgi:hypothetical protein